MIGIAFFGRVHHTLKMASIVNGLIGRNVQISALITDNSINIDPPNEFFKELSILKYSHIKDYLSIDDVAKINESMDNVDQLYSLPNIHKTVSPFWVAASIREALENIIGFRKYFEEVNPDFVLGLHEQNFFIKTMFYVASTMGIATYTLQEGILLSREEDDLKKFSRGSAYTTTVFSWSDYDSKSFSGQGDVIAVGPTHLDEWIRRRHDIDKYLKYKVEYRSGMGLRLSRPTIAFIPPRLDLYVGDFIDDMRKLANWTNGKNINVVLRLHPFEHQATKKIVFDSIVSKYQHIVMDEDLDSLSCISGSDAVITQTSTASMEAVALGVPVIEIDTGYNGLEQPLHLLGAATLLSGDNWGVIESVLNGTFDIDGINKFLQERLSLADGNATNRMIAKIIG